MASIKINVISKTNPSNLNIRFYHGRDVDCNAQSNILIDPNIWSNKLQSLKPSADSSLKSHYNEKINDIKNHIIISFNNDFTKGKQIDSSWLKSIIKELHNRPKGDNDFTTYFTPFTSVYIEESKSRLNLRTGKKNISIYNKKV